MLILVILITLWSLVSGCFLAPINPQRGTYFNIWERTIGPFTFNHSLVSNFTVGKQYRVDTTSGKLVRIPSVLYKTNDEPPKLSITQYPCSRCDLYVRIPYAFVNHTRLCHCFTIVTIPGE